MSDRLLRDSDQVETRMVIPLRGWKSLAGCAEKLLFDVPSYKFGVRRQRRRFGFLSIFVVSESKAASR